MKIRTKLNQNEILSSALKLLVFVGSAIWILVSGEVSVTAFCPAKVFYIQTSVRYGCWNEVARGLCPWRNCMYDKLWSCAWVDLITSSKQRRKRGDPLTTAPRGYSTPSSHHNPLFRNLHRRRLFHFLRKQNFHLLKIKIKRENVVAEYYLQYWYYLSNGRCDIRC